MTQAKLLEDIVLRLRELFKGYSLPNKAGVLQEVRVFPQYLPHPEGITFTDKDKSGLKGYGETDFESNFPCVIVKLTEQTDSEELGDTGAIVGVTILTGIFDETADCQGYIDILNMQEKIRGYLLEHRVLADKYLLQMPFTTKLLEDDTFPIYFGEQKMKYIVARPVMGHEYIYGRRIPHC